MEPNKYGQQLKSLRLRKNLTQKELAATLGKAESTVRMWELGKNNPDMNTLNILASLYGVSIDFIAGRDYSIPLFRSIEKFTSFYMQYSFSLPSNEHIRENLGDYKYSIDDLVVVDRILYGEYKSVVLCEIDSDIYAPAYKKGDYLIFALGEDVKYGDMALLGTPKMILNNKKMKLDCNIVRHEKEGFINLPTQTLLEPNSQSRPVARIIREIKKV